MIGTHAALLLRERGFDVTVGGRSAPDEGSLISDFPVLTGDYTNNDFGPDDLEPFDAIVFAAGNDIRHLSKDADTAEFWRRTQTEGVPRFAAAAKKAGVARFVQVGSYYHHVMPELALKDEYVRARQEADEGARALADDTFNASTLNPPSIVGAIPGTSLRRFGKMAAWARGEIPKVPDFGPAGGTNYMSVRSLVQAIAGALQNAESGKAYLIGDENLTFTQFFQLWVDATGKRMTLPELDQEHPFQPDAFIVPGRGTVLSYEPNPAETAMLSYDRNDVRRAVEEIVAAVESQQ